MIKFLKELWVEMVRTFDEDCPVCGYYCLGKGGHGCIDKPHLQHPPKG